jgi:ketosteroid isomerase-like protein
MSMRAEQHPITGTEDLASLSDTQRVLAEFYAAFNGWDLEGMARNWADTDDVVMDNPLGGIVRGWAEIRAVYERIFAGPGMVTVELFDYTLHEAGELFYAVGRERGELRTDAMVLELAIRTTRIFRRIGGRWRQVHHHGSFDDPDVLARYQEEVGTSAKNAPSN